MQKTQEARALAVGIDIGTTTVSAVVYDLLRKETVEAASHPHDSYVSSGERTEQSVACMLGTAESLLYRILASYEGVVSIGLTGQMHGIVYVNGEGEPLSSLINWQDKRADQILPDGKSTCDTIFDLTGVRVYAGYGLATHFYNLRAGEVPEGAVAFCSIMDLLAMRICGFRRPMTHASVAAGFGLFDVERGAFMSDKLSLLGVEESFLPRVTGESAVVGTCRGIPVSVAIGDNQASFLGSVKENGTTLLINVGTGSQVSAVGDYRETARDTEVRPFIEGKYLICGSALCGGYAYSMVERFFRSYVASAGTGDGPQYDTVNRLAAEAYARGEAMDVDVSFLGRRSDPTRRGAITGIGRENFTPGGLILGVLRGMCNELYELYASFGETRGKIVASGGAVRKNELLRTLLSERFGMEVSVYAAEEEAATGAALFSALAAGKIAYTDGFSDHIRYL